MEIKKLKPTVEYSPELPGCADVFKLTVRYVGLDESIDFYANKDAPVPRASEKVREQIYSAVVGWNFTENGEPVPCTDENKRAILPLYLGRKLADGVPLAWNLVLFIRDEANFLGN